MQNQRICAYLGWFLGCLLYVYAMLYTKMFHGYDKMKHFKTYEISEK